MYLSRSMRVSVLPAHAGMIPSRERSQAAVGSAPRACGDDPEEAEAEGIEH